MVGIPFSPAELSHSVSVLALLISFLLVSLDRHCLDLRCCQLQNGQEMIEAGFASLLFSVRLPDLHHLLCVFSWESLAFSVPHLLTLSLMGLLVSRFLISIA